MLALIHSYSIGNNKAETNITVQHLKNFNLDDILTPIKVDKLRELLINTKFDPQETEFLFKGFSEGFDFGYRGPKNHTNLSWNIPIHVGSKTEMWNKVIKEVKLGRVAEPYCDKPPFKHFIQSPIGLVPKGEDQTRLIFHMSYDFSEKFEEKSFNFHTLAEFCSVRYNDLEHTIENCIKLIKKFPDLEVIYFSKTDLSSAFRQVPGKPDGFQWLCMQATNPGDGTVLLYYRQMHALQS